MNIINQKKFDNRKLLSPEIKKTWVEALRSGKYLQGKFQLKYNNTYCCIGVLCEINYKLDEQGFLSDGNENYLNDELVKEFNMDSAGKFEGFEIEGYSSLVQLNDDGNFTFNEIADIIEKYF